MATTGTKGVSDMTQLPINFTPSYSMSPSASEEDVDPQLETQTVGHPYMVAQVRMRRKQGTEPVKENGNIPDNQPSIEMMSLKIELDKAKTELNRRTVVFSNHYSSMVEKWKHEKTKREVAENVAVEKARDNMVLQRTHFSLQQRAKKSAGGVLTPPVPVPVPETKGDEGTEGDDPIGLTGSEDKDPIGLSGSEDKDLIGLSGSEDKDLIGLTESEDKDLIGLTESEDKDLIGLTEENQKLTLEIQDLKDTVQHLEGQISESKANSDEQELELDEFRAKLTEMELELKQSKSYMVSAQHQYKNLAGRLHHEKGKREVAENVAVNKARELEVQKRTSVMVLSSLSHAFCVDNVSAPVQVQSSLETIDYATKISSLETEVEDLKESRVTLEAALSKYEQECDKKDSEIKQLRQKVFLSGENENNIALTQSVAMPSTYGNNDMSSTENQLLQSSEFSSIGPVGYRRTEAVLGGTMDRVKRKKVSAVQSKEQLQQELKSKEAMISIMKEKLEHMKIQGSREDPCLEVERRELEDQVGGLDRKLSSMNTEEKGNENEVDELREKLENVEKKAADFEEKNRYYQELLGKMSTSSEYQSSSRPSSVSQTASPINIPPPPPNLPPLPPPPLPEGLFGPATPQLVIQPLGQRSSQAMKADSRVEAMNELMSMLSSGKVHLKRARNRVPAPREDPPPLILPKAILKRQATAPSGHDNLQSSYEAPAFFSVAKQTQFSAETIDERLRLNKKERESSETVGGSELFMKLNRRYRNSEDTIDFSGNAQLPKIDSNPLPALPAVVTESKPKPTARRKVTPIPSVSPVPSRKIEDIAPIMEDEEPPTPPPTDQSASPVKQMFSPSVSPNKPKLQSPLLRQSSSDQSKPPLKTPILPPTNRERVQISAKPKPELKREKSGSTPCPAPAPIPAKPSKLKGIFRKEVRSNSTENLSPTQGQRFARAATDGELDSENDPGETSIQKVKIPQHFADN